MSGNVKLCSRHRFFFFFFAAKSGGSKCQWEMRRTDEQGCVCRQTRGWRGGRRGVGNSERTVWRSGLSKKQQQQQPRDAPGEWDVPGRTCCQAPPDRGALGCRARSPGVYKQGILMRKDVRFKRKNLHSAGRWGGGGTLHILPYSPCARTCSFFKLFLF